MQNNIYVETAAALAKKAGAIIRDKFGGNFERGYKSCPSDLVTEVDRMSESLITGGLSEKFPGHIIIGEENSGYVKDIPEGFAWYVDPLDGTTNFVYGIPFCSVSIGLARGGKMVAGVVYDPFRDECFSAATGCGTSLNGRPVRVDHTRKLLREALLVTGYPENKKFSERLYRINYQKVAKSCGNLRALGSAALELAYISCGRLTGFWENTLMPWDVAAGSLLVEEAGGKVTDIDGNALTLESYLSITASNSLVHEELLRTLQ
ncbi:inositol monophosphatase family protein [Pelotomaculum propionicicum]